LEDAGGKELFEDFKNSFSYGSRTDLSFKFLKGLDVDEAGEFFSALLDEVGGLLDDPSTERLVDLVYRWQVRAYRPRPGVKSSYVYDDRPFQVLGKPLSETTLGLVTSSGHFMSDDPPPTDAEGLNQQQTTLMIDEFLRRAPHLSEIPTEASTDDLVVRHPGYDIRSVSADPEVALPRSLLVEAEKDGRIGRLSSTVYSFVGVCSQGRLRNELDSWIDGWKSAGIEALFLVPV